MSGDGGIVVPASVREAHGWKEGVELEFVDGRDGVMIQPASTLASPFAGMSKEEFLEGRVKIDRPFPTDKEIEATLLEEAARRFDATRR